MRLHTYLMEAQSAFHFGEVGLDVEKAGEYAAADRLFSALCTMIHLTQGVERLEALLALYNEGRPPFLLTGAYPYVRAQDGEIIRFFPAPLTLKQTSEKSARKVRWLSEAMFRRVLDGDFDIDGDKDTIVGDKWLSADERDRLGAGVFWTTGDDARVPRVTVDRQSNASAVYSAGRLKFPQGGGLWCGFDIRDEGWHADDLRVLLDVLGDDGFGGERSNGHGRFTLHDTGMMELPDVGDYFVTISHYAPRLDGETAAFTASAASYDLALRRGFMSSTTAGRQYPRQMVRMAVPGSVLQAQPERSTYGRLVDVTPINEEGVRLIEHPVYRYGYALPVGIQITEEGV